MGVGGFLLAWAWLSARKVWFCCGERVLGVVLQVEALGVEYLAKQRRNAWAWTTLRLGLLWAWLPLGVVFFIKSLWGFAGFFVRFCEVL